MATEWKTAPEEGCQQLKLKRRKGTNFRAALKLWGSTIFTIGRIEQRVLMAWLLKMQEKSF